MQERERQQFGSLHVLKVNYNLFCFFFIMGFRKYQSYTRELLLLLELFQVSSSNRNSRVDVVSDLNNLK